MSIDGRNSSASVFKRMYMHDVQTDATNRWMHAE